MTEDMYNAPQDPGMNDAGQPPVQQPEIPQEYQQPAYGYEQASQGYEQAPQGYEQAPQGYGYAPQPAPQEGYQQPTYGEQAAPRPRKARSSGSGNSDIPRFVNKEKLPVIVGVLFAIFAGAALVSLVGNILGLANYDGSGVWATSVYYNNYGLELAFSILMLAGAVLLLLGVLLRKPLLATIGICVVAPSVLRAYKFVFPWVTYGLEVCALILVSLYYILRGRGINALIKKIAVLSGCGLAVVTIVISAILGFVKVPDLASGTLTYLLVSLIGALSLYAGLYLYRPGMKVFQEQPAIIQSGEPYPPVRLVKTLCIVFMGLAGALFILGIVNSAVFRNAWVVWMGLYAVCAIAASVLMFIGAILNRPNKLFAFGVLAAAFGVIFRMYVSHYTAAVFAYKNFAFGEVIAGLLYFVELISLVGIGVHYFLHGNGIGAKLKTILTFVGMGAGAVATLLCDLLLVLTFTVPGVGAQYIILSILFFVVDLAAVGMLFLPILFYKRGMMQRVQQPRAPRPQQPQQPW